MSKLGTVEKPIIVRVHSDEKARYVAETCAKYGWQYIIGFEPVKQEGVKLPKERFVLRPLVNPCYMRLTEEISISKLQIIFFISC